ncbi:MAG: (d)CMP kinase [Desulfobulbaceae bacterium]|nr:MAG: (d)CMP kinase [Desulfobulbaceae bacterium]
MGAEKIAIVTIDGPSGAGKSTISRRLARRLGFTYLDTGAMYRAVGLHIHRLGLNFNTVDPGDALDPVGVLRLPCPAPPSLPPHHSRPLRPSDVAKTPGATESLNPDLIPNATDFPNPNSIPDVTGSCKPHLNHTSDDLTFSKALETCLMDLIIELTPTRDDDVRVHLNGEDVSTVIRRPEMALAASRISAYPQIRRKLTELQREIAVRAQGGLVAEGRDMGTVVFPAAAHKFYLDAAPEIRAQRRCAQMRLRGEEPVYREILEQIKKRDYADSQRALAPLRPAVDAVIVDSSRLSPEAVVDFMLSKIQQN